MESRRNLVRIVIASNALGRIAAIATQNETPAAQWRTLSILQEQGPQRLGEIARLSRVSQPSMTRLITTMTEAGLVVRTPDPSDSRASLIKTTDEGIEALAAWRAQLNETVQPVFENLSEREWDVLEEAAEILTTQIDAWNG